MDYKKLNEALIDLSEYTLKRKYEQVLVKTPDDYFQEKNQSDTSLKTEIYKLDFDDLFSGFLIHTFQKLSLLLKP